MANTILSKRSGVAGAAPNSLQYGEVAINYADGKMFYKDTGNTIRVVGYNWNVASATKLATARTINGVAFDGTQDITIPSDTSDALALAIALG
jgi:hypothetical protein